MYRVENVDTDGSKCWMKLVALSTRFAGQTETQICVRRRPQPCWSDGDVSPMLVRRRPSDQEIGITVPSDRLDVGPTVEGPKLNNTAAHNGTSSLAAAFNTLEVFEGLFSA